MDTLSPSSSSLLERVEEENKELRKLIDDIHTRMCTIEQENKSLKDTVEEQQANLYCLGDKYKILNERTKTLERTIPSPTSSPIVQNNQHTKGGEPSTSTFGYLSNLFNSTMTAPPNKYQKSSSSSSSALTTNNNNPNPINNNITTNLSPIRIILSRPSQGFEKGSIDKIQYYLKTKVHLYMLNKSNINLLDFNVVEHEQLANNPLNAITKGVCLYMVGFNSARIIFDEHLDHINKLRVQYPCCKIVLGLWVYGAKSEPIQLDTNNATDQVLTLIHSNGSMVDEKCAHAIEIINNLIQSNNQRQDK
ncbi:hypothetical protein DFA_00461 [Cavenderia fasciculata]|uniref:Uncharacterized protein n=1 Tax=Cavenderia fasciculata TaxID=261658 RepID=F4PS02_CACFS|nr:uncharacterized protein DFA_00461 [Cavenderia fasciculata]EGG20600.1 hypothetical protein DFA_00461 [Cavenderia fasciculata]|eukprot:XP_004358450.1 hypothetical protein DFA_00461 [Cavenderia fasciculata]